MSDISELPVTTVKIAGPLSIYNVFEHKHRLLDDLKRSAVLELDLGEVDEFDSAGFQLLMLLKRESLQGARGLRLVALSECVRQMLDFYRMSAFLGDVSKQPA